MHPAPQQGYGILTADPHSKALPEMIDVDSFTDDQKQLLSLIVDDFGGPTATPSLLMILERVLYALKPDWALDKFDDEPDLREDIETCLAALNYYKISQVTQGR